MKKETDVVILPDISDTLKEIGLKVRTLRKAIDRNYESFAKEYNINKVTLARIENGNKNYNIISLIEVLRAMDVNLDDFFKDIK